MISSKDIMGKTVSKSRIILVAAVLLAFLVAFLVMRPPGVATVRGSGDVLTIAATGDTLIAKPLDVKKAAKDVASLLNSSSVAVTNLEENLLDPVRIPKAEDAAEVRWPYGTKATAKDLRALGFALVSLANNHGTDYGVDGLTQTEQILDQAGLPHAGAGQDLAEASAPVFIGKAPRRVAMIAVAISASPASHATRARGDILGRPGVNALRYAPDVKADAATFATLKQSPAASKSTESELTVSGKTIRKAPETAVEMIADKDDAEGILAQVRDARKNADVVIVTVHSHEPSNRSEQPADFLRMFAHSAIDAGASMVIGQGPHRLRGIEVYRGGVVFYSLGNFAFDLGQVNPRAEDAYEAGVDLYRLALGSISDSDAMPERSDDDPLLWESVIAIGRYERGVLRSVELRPIDLGVGQGLRDRGTPHFADASKSQEILTRLNRLSGAFGTRIRIENGMGFIEF